MTAARLAEAGRTVTVVEEGPWIDPDSMVRSGSTSSSRSTVTAARAAALGRPPWVCRGTLRRGSTEINSGLWHRLPSELTEEWQRKYESTSSTPAELDRYAEDVEDECGVSRLPGAPPATSAVLERGATKLGWRNVEFPRSSATSPRVAA